MSRAEQMRNADSYFLQVSTDIHPPKWLEPLATPMAVQVLDSFTSISFRFCICYKNSKEKKCAFNFDPPSDPWCPQLCRRSEKDMSGLRQTLLFFHRQSSQWVFSLLGFRSNEWVCLVCNLSLSLIKAPCLEACLLPLGCSYLWAAMFLLCFAWYLECKCWLKWTC